MKAIGRPPEIALYWFLRWYESANGEPYPYTTNVQLAEDAKLTDSTIGNILKNPPEFLALETAKIRARW